jgi:hypothetical protein
VEGHSPAENAGEEYQTDDRRFKLPAGHFFWNGRLDYRPGMAAKSGAGAISGLASLAVIW